MSRLHFTGSWRLVTLAVAAALVLAFSAGAVLVARADTPTTFLRVSQEHRRPRQCRAEPGLAAELQAQ
jgi:hypothetical protein